MNREIFFYIAAFLIDAGIGVLSVAVPLRAIEMNASPFILGFIGFLLSLFYLSFSLVFGRLSDKKGSRPFMVGGCLIFLFSAIFFLFVNSLTRIFILMGLVGVGMGMFWSPMEVWIAKVSDNLPKSIGHFSVAWCAGIAVGSFTSGALFQIDWRLPFLIIALSSMLALFFVYRCPLVSSAPIVHQAAKGKEDKTRSSFLQIGWILNFAAWFGVGTVRYLFPKLAVDLNITPFVLGVLMFLIGAIQALISYIMGKTSGWHYRFKVLVLIQILMCFGFLILVFSSSVLLFLCAFIVFGIGMGVAYFSSLYYSLTGGHSQGERSGIHEMLVGSGGLAGPLIGGIVAQSFNMRAPFILCAVLMLVAMVIAKYIYSKYEKMQTDN